MNNPHAMRFCVEKNRTPQRIMSLKNNLLLRYPDSGCSDSYQIRDLWPENDG